MAATQEFGLAPVIVAGLVLGIVGAALPARAQPTAPNVIWIENATRGSIHCKLRSADAELADVTLDAKGSFRVTATPDSRLILACPHMQSLPFGPVSPGFRYAFVVRNGRITLAQVVPETPGPAPGPAS